MMEDALVQKEYESVQVRVLAEVTVFSSWPRHFKPLQSVPLAK